MALFSEQSMMTFEGEQYMGQENIYNKLSSFGQISHNVKQLDAQPTINDGIMVLITGELTIEGSENPMMFTEIFHLQQGGAQGYYVHNDIFRLNLS